MSQADLTGLQVGTHTPVEGPCLGTQMPGTPQGQLHVCRRGQAQFPLIPCYLS